MKLLYITNGINGSGGLERVLSVKASALAEDFGYEVSILCLNKGGENPFYTFSPKIRIRSIEVGGNPLQYLKQYKKGLQRAVDHLQPDVISVCDDGLKGFFLPSLIKTKAKWIYERHASIQLNTNTSVKGKIMQWLMKLQVPKFDRFVVLTNGNVAEWDMPNVIAIPNPLSFETHEVSPLDEKRIIAVGSLSYNKGYDMLLDIWQKLEPRYPDWRLDVFGKADPDNLFKKMAQEKQLKSLFFHDPVQDIKKEYLESAVLVLPSRSEGFGMVLIEAMACGVPCVAFDCPSGPADIIINNEDGLLVEKENTHALAEKLILLIEDAALRKKMGKKARENVKRYEAQEIVRQWDVLFREL